MIEQRYFAIKKQLENLQIDHSTLLSGQGEQSEHFMAMAHEIQTLSIQLADC